MSVLTRRDETKAEREARLVVRRAKYHARKAAAAPADEQHLDVDGVDVVVSAVDVGSHVYSATIDRRYVGLVFRVDRGEPHHVQNEAHHAAHIWFYRAGEHGAPVGPYPDYRTALDALVKEP